MSPSHRRSPARGLDAASRDGLGWHGHCCCTNYGLEGEIEREEIERGEMELTCGPHMSACYSSMWASVELFEDPNRD